MTERILVPGIKREGTKVNYDVNPSGQSFLIENGNSVFVTRELGQSQIDITQEEEVRLRKLSTELHQQYLPNYTLPTQHVLLQGRQLDGKKTTLLGRFSPKLKNVAPITSVRTREIIQNSGLCMDISKISFGQLRIVLKEGRLPDSGGHGGFGSSLPKPISSFTTRMTSDNILVGIDSEGEKRVFCDPDWSIYPQGNFFKRNKARVKVACVYSARAIFFYGMSKMPDFITRKLSSLVPSDEGDVEKTKDASLIVV